MTVYLFDKDKALSGEISEIVSYTQKTILNGMISASISAVYSPDIEDAFYFGSKDIEDENIFTMYRIASLKKQNGLIDISGIHLLFDELQAEVIRDIRPRDVSASIALDRILQGSLWEVGTSLATSVSSGSYYYQSRLSAFWDFLKSWECEFVPRIVFEDGEIVGRYIDIYDSLSDDYGKWYEYGGKLVTIVAEQANEKIYTALIGMGKGEQTGEGFGRKITFENTLWSTANGDPVDKPIGQDYVSLPSAVDTYGFREAVIDFPEIEDEEDLLVATYNLLTQTARPKVEFSSTAAEDGVIEIGETVTVVRDDLGIRYKTRVFELVRNFLNNHLKTFKFGDKVAVSSAERIREEEYKNEERLKEHESLIVAVRDQIKSAYWNEDGYNYELKIDNEYGLPGGYYSFDRPIDDEPTKVIYVGAGQMLIANSKDPNGEWEWKTAATPDGLVGDAIVAYSVTSNKLASDVGESLDISSNISIMQRVTKTQILTDPEIQEALKGSDGQSIISSTPEYYLSTSNSTQTGGSWSTTVPAYESGKYIWTRLKNVFANPTETKYTTPILDVLNNALNDIYDSGMVLPTSKPALMIRFSEIAEEYDVLSAEDSPSLGSTKWPAYDSATQALALYLGQIVADMSSTSEIDVSYLETLTENYKKALEELRDDLAKKEREAISVITERLDDAEWRLESDQIVGQVLNSERFVVPETLSGVEDYLTGLIEGLTTDYSTFKQTAEEFQLALATQVEEGGKVIEDVRAHLTFTKDEDGRGVLSLGDNLDDMYLRQMKDRISFMNGELELAYFAERAMNVFQLFVEKLSFPEFGIENLAGTDVLEVSHYPRGI